MQKANIVEITSWDYATDAGVDFEVLYERGAGGVVIKASQGDNWCFDRLPEAIRGAKSAGLLVGVIHYAEPGRNPAQVEAEHLIDNLPDDDLPLGLWLELDDLGGKQTFEMGEWVLEFFAYATTPTARPVLACSTELLNGIPEAPFGRPWVCTDGDEPQPGAWAFAWHEDAPTGFVGPHSGVDGYTLRSVRGLNAPGSGRRAIYPLPTVTTPVVDAEAASGDVTLADEDGEIGSDED